MKLSLFSQTPTTEPSAVTPKTFIGFETLVVARRAAARQVAGTVARQVALPSGTAAPGWTVISAGRGAAPGRGCP